ncbi:MAG: helix-turn-helix domain-containing protein [Nevskiales bacterium]
MSQDTEIPITGDLVGDDTVPKAESSRSAISPGEMLRHARESRNLTIADLAGQTRLSRAVLEALEKNDFANLAMPVYVRGYFRKCAHVLNLPEDRLLQAYADWTGTPLTPQPLPVTVNEPLREYASPTRTPSWRYVLIIAIVLGAVLWWFGSGEEIASQAPAQTTAPVTTLEIDPPALAESQPLPLTLADETTPAQTSASTPASTDTVANPAAVLAPGPGAGTEPATASSALPAQTTVAAPAPASALPPAGPTTLQLSISQTSWVEIYDDDNKRLLYGLFRPGTEQRVTGKLPYEVVLGHPQGVKLSMGGKAIDLAAHTSGNGTARFEVKKP